LLRCLQIGNPEAAFRQRQLLAGTASSRPSPRAHPGAIARLASGCCRRALRTGSPGQLQTYERPRIRHANDRFESAAAIGRRPLEGAHPPKRSFKGRRRLSTPGAGCTSAGQSAEQALPTRQRRSRERNRGPEADDRDRTFRPLLRGTATSTPSCAAPGRLTCSSSSRRACCCASVPALPAQWASRSCEPSACAPTTRSNEATLSARDQRNCGVRGIGHSRVTWTSYSPCGPSLTSSLRAACRSRRVSSAAHWRGVFKALAP
jgi:hypothetical protein